MAVNALTVPTVSANATGSTIVVQASRFDPTGIAFGFGNHQGITLPGDRPAGDRGLYVLGHFESLTVVGQVGTAGDNDTTWMWVSGEDGTGLAVGAVQSDGSVAKLIGHQFDAGASTTDLPQLLNLDAGRSLNYTRHISARTLSVSDAASGIFIPTEEFDLTGSAIFLGDPRPMTFYRSPYGVIFGRANAFGAPVKNSLFIANPDTTITIDLDQETSTFISTSVGVTDTSIVATDGFGGNLYVVTRTGTTISFGAPQSSSFGGDLGNATLWRADPTHVFITTSSGNAGYYEISGDTLTEQYFTTVGGTPSQQSGEDFLLYLIGFDPDTGRAIYEVWQMSTGAFVGGTYEDVSGVGDNYTGVRLANVKTFVYPPRVNTGTTAVVTLTRVVAVKDIVPVDAGISTATLVQAQD